jgi:hypothetical protein
MFEPGNINRKDLREFRKIIQLFIDGKMNSYTKIRVWCDIREESITVEKRMYQASLFMIHRMLNTMELPEIAGRLDIPDDLLRTWKNEKIFKTLMYSNYKEFLIYLGELYT